MHDCLGKQCVYTQLVVRQHACIRDCPGKRHVHA
jgi:hypothetical protein